jgi:hypothetical protein
MYMLKREGRKRGREKLMGMVYMTISRMMHKFIIWGIGSLLRI